MGVRHQSKIELARALRGRYLRASRGEKGRMVDELVAVTGYHRQDALRVLRHGPPGRMALPQRAGRRAHDGPRIDAALRVAAEATGWICGKRLVGAVPELIPALEGEGVPHQRAEERTALGTTSAATIDRRPRAARRGAKPRGLATTKPGGLLKHQVPIRPSAHPHLPPWDEQPPLG